MGLIPQLVDFHAKEFGTDRLVYVVFFDVLPNFLCFRGKDQRHPIRDHLQRPHASLVPIANLRLFSMGSITTRFIGAPYC